jgi:hypothetical protein
MEVVMRVVCFLGRVLVAAACLAPVAALCHGTAEDGHPVEIDVLDCAKPPANALRLLPAPIDRWATLACFPTGQRLTQGSGWQWRYPGSYLVTPFLPAEAPLASRETPGAKYFVHLDVARLDVDEAAAVHERLAQSLGVYERTPAPQALYRVEAGNNLGHDFELFFSMTSDDAGWAILCAPDCRPENVVRMNAIPR